MTLNAQNSNGYDYDRIHGSLVTDICRTGIQ